MKPAQKMRARMTSRLFAALFAAAALTGTAFDSVNAQSALATNDLVDELKGLETTPNIDVAAMRQRALARAKSNTDKSAVNRVPIAEELFKLPQLTIEIQFNLDSAIIRPASYPTLGRIADALYHPYLLGYRVLVVGHTDSTGKREHNLVLSQKRADSIREALVTTFKIPPQRVLSVGLGEEQFQDAANPTAAINRRVQIVTVGLMK
jgi:outer membrane protein OmpA-like peptidoglycan-associated protein